MNFFSYNCLTSPLDHTRRLKGKNMKKEEVQKLVSAILQRQKEWLNADELEAEFSISKSTQAKMRMARTIPFHKIGKYVRYHRPDINQMFEDAKVV